MMPRNSTLTIQAILLQVVGRLSVVAASQCSPSNKWNSIVTCKSAWMWRHPISLRTTVTCTPLSNISRKFCTLQVEFSHHLQIWEGGCSNQLFPTRLTQLEATFWQSQLFGIAMQFVIMSNGLAQQCICAVTGRTWPTYYRYRQSFCWEHVLLGLLCWPIHAFARSFNWSSVVISYSKVYKIVYSHYGQYSLRRLTPFRLLPFNCLMSLWTKVV